MKSASMLSSSLSDASGASYGNVEGNECSVSTGVGCSGYGMVDGTDDGTGVGGAGGCGCRLSLSLLVVDEVGGGNRLICGPLTEGGGCGFVPRQCDEPVVGSGRLIAGRLSDGGGSDGGGIGGSVGYGTVDGILGSRLVDGCDGIDGSGVTCRVGTLGEGGIGVCSSSMSIGAGGGIVGGCGGLFRCVVGRQQASQCQKWHVQRDSCSVTVRHCSQ